MAITRERFQSGLTYDQYKAQMTRNQERFEANERQAPLTPDDVQAFQRLPKPLDVLVLAEDWCGDVIAYLPILGRLAKESGKLNVRVFLRDQNLDIMDQYLNQGHFRSIPVFVFFDEQFNEVGRFTERPAAVTQLRMQKQEEMYAKHPEFGAPGTPVDQLPEDMRAKLSQEMAQIRDDIAPFGAAQAVHQMRIIAEQLTR
ncbi:MAG: thioredoxin family protein [Chloroflexota bacterium]